MRILILANNDIGLYCFRKELLEELIKCKYEVYICLPKGELISNLKEIGCKYIDCPLLNRHGTNPVQDIRLLLYYIKIIKKIKPNIVFTYTIKPNVYGGFACSILHIPYVVNITGLGTAIENGGVLQRITLLLYKIGMKKARKIFFQNEENRNYMLKKNVVKGEHELLPGSGVNLDRFPIREYPDDENGVVRFAFISRIMKEKGIDYYLAAAKVIRKKYPKTEFHVCGFCEAEYEGKLNEYNDNGIVIYHGMIRDVAEFLEDIHCVIHPTYYPEGLSNVLLEASASGRPIITTDRSGCREVIDDGVNGYMIPCQNGKKLIEAVDKFLKLSNDERKKMGLAGRAKVQKEFDRQIVVQMYIDEVEQA